MGSSIRVLVVGDETADADHTAASLERISDSIETTVEASPGDALDRVVDGGSFDCVVSDFEMDGMDGLELLEEVRAVAPDLPFILFTGKGSEEIASDAISAGVTDYLQKQSGTQHYDVLANRIHGAVSEGDADRATERMRRVFERVTDAFFALDDEWTITYANERAATYTDYSREELVGEDVRTALSEAVDEALYDAFERAFDSQRPVTLETTTTPRAGSWLEVRIYPSEDGLSVYVRDVTEQRDARVELRETKRKIESLHDVATRAVACTTEQDIYDLAIEAAEEILEFDVSIVDSVEDDELVPRAVSADVPEDGYYETTPIDTDDNLAARSYREGESTLIADLRETDVMPADSEYRSVLTVPVGEYGILQTISKRPGEFDEDDLELAELLAAHLTEALTRVKSEAELRAERDRFASLFENVPNPVVRYETEDGEAIGRSVNPAFEAVFGWDAGEVVGDSLDDYVLPEDDRETGIALNEQVDRGVRVEGLEVHRETSEGVRDFLLHTAPAGTEGGSEAFAIYVDITEQKERERKLARQNERLEEFAHVVSHDLRNPLNVASGHHELVAADCDSDHVEPLGRALDRMDALVEDLLTLARRGQVVDETEPISLSAAAETAWRTADTGAASLSIADDPVVEADDARFRELLENLFRNAVEHGSTGSQPRTDDAAEHGSTSTPPADEDAVEHAGTDVAVEVGALPDRQGFYVADDGPGIPDEQTDRVLEHGFTTATDGTGFGLAIVASIADAHGWEVEVETSESGGARFEFSMVSVREDGDPAR